MPTREEVKKLKWNWQGDPCWDLEDIEGFEEHREELRKWRAKWEQIWTERKEERLLKKAEQIGCPGNMTLAAYVETLEQRLEKLENKWE